MIDLNGLCAATLANAELRQKNGGHIKSDTRSMLKHCATEVVEAMDAYNTYCYVDWQSVSPGDRIEPVNLTAREAMAHFASELADIVCCVLIIAGKEFIDIEKAINGCVEKNRKRAEGTGDKL